MDPSLSSSYARRAVLPLVMPRRCDDAGLPAERRAGPARGRVSPGPRDRGRRGGRDDDPSRRRAPGGEGRPQPATPRTRRRSRSATGWTGDRVKPESRRWWTAGRGLDPGRNLRRRKAAESHLETTTVIDRAIGRDRRRRRRETGRGRWRASSTAAGDGPAAAMLAYELGELYERRLAARPRGQGIRQGAALRSGAARQPWEIASGLPPGAGPN